MPDSAPKTQVLITDVGSYLGQELARNFLLASCQVYGIAKSTPPHDLVAQKDFTLLEIDLAQPLPPHLPKFDLVLFLSHENSPFMPGLSGSPNLSPALINVLSLARHGQSKVALTLPIATDTQIYDFLIEKEEEKQKLLIFLVGDPYGPAMDFKSHSQLAHLISQAIHTDKVILENEGMNTVYPAYITDVISGINRFLFTQNPNGQKGLHVIVSQSPMTSLSVAYEIQKAARSVLGRELNLFFAGAGPTTLETQQIINAHDLGFDPKINLEEGLKLTFAHFLKHQGQSSTPPGNSHRVAQARVAPEKGKIAGLASKIPFSKMTKPLRLKKSSGSSNRRRIALAALAILILFIAKTGLDVYFGVSSLKSAQKQATAGDFKNAQASAARAAGSFRSADAEISFALKPLNLIIPQKVNMITKNLDAASQIAASVDSLTKGAGQLAADMAIISQKDSKSEGLDFESPPANFQSAYFASSRAMALSQNGMAALYTAASQINNLSQSAFELSKLIGDLTGQTSPKSYLLLLENNTELRPGGGFIGNIATIDFESGRLKNIAVEDVYTVDGQLKEKITPPPQIKDKLGTDAFYLRDSSWSPDFGLNSQIARDFFKKETGKNVDGVISLDLAFLQEVLDKSGPIKLADFNEEITAQNLFEKGEYYSEVGFFPGSTQKRDFFGALTRALINKILAGLNPKDNSKDKISLLSLVEAAKDGLAQKHIMLALDGPTLAAYIRTHDWNRPIPPASFNPGDDAGKTRDFLAISEANLGANKVNRFIDRKITYEMTIGRDADLVANLKIVYTNNSQAQTWPGGKYVNYLRVYTPGLITLLSVDGQEKVDPKIVQVSTQGNLSSIATYVEVQPKSTKEINFTYRLPKNIKLETAPTYHLYVQKQPGTDRDPFEFKLNLPGYLVAKSVNGTDQAPTQNLGIKTDLLTDREFQIEVAKK